MKIAKLGVLLILSFACIARSEISLKNIDRQEDYALADRLMLMSQSKSLPPSEAFKSLDSLDVKTEIFMLIEDLRGKAKSIRKTYATNSIWGRALTPACFQVREKGSFTKPESHACFAGDALIHRQLKLRSNDYISEILAFSNLALKVASENPQEVDLFEVFQKLDPKADVKKFWSFIAAISTSGNSGLTGWLQSLEDRILVEDLNSNLSDQEVYVRFKNLQVAKLRYQILRDYLDKKKIKLLIFGKDVNQWNRHNMMAAFLGCMDIMPREDLQLNAIANTGKAYEALDFISHIVSGISFKDSVKNYQQDTQRYLVSSSFGLMMCREGE